MASGKYMGVTYYIGREEQSTFPAYHFEINFNEGSYMENDVHCEDMKACVRYVKDIIRKRRGD